LTRSVGWRDRHDYVDADGGSVSEPKSKAFVFQRVGIFLVWCILLGLCWPLALLGLMVYQLVWILLIPFRMVGMAVDGVLGVVRAVVMRPVRLLSGPRAL
jgi:hypothetical protein